MNKEIQERIECIKNNQLPKGYRRIKDIGIAPEDWTLGKLSDVIENVSRPVPKPKEPYWRLGIKSWAKGTFHAFVDDPEAVNMDELYEVKENDLIVNITFAWEHAIAIAKKEDEGLLVSHRFPTYVFKEGQIPEYYQAVIAQRYFKDMLDHISPGGAGRNRVLNRKAFSNLPCVIPSKTEQEKIAQIFTSFDEIIERYENQKEELMNLKRFYLKNMFPDKKSNTPKTRFSRFDAPWSRFKIQEIANRYDNLRVPIAANLRVQGSTPYYGANGIQDYVEGFTHEGEFVLVAEDGANDLKDYPINCVRGRIWVNNHAHVLQAKLDLADNYFLSYAIKNANIESLLVGGGRAKLNAETLMNIEVALPSLEEQQVIGEYIKCLDDCITLYQKMIDIQKDYKKAISRLLLTGVVRV